MSNRAFNTRLSQAVYIGFMGLMVFTTTRFTVPECRLYYNVASVKRI